MVQDKYHLSIFQKWARCVDEMRLFSISQVRDRVFEQIFSCRLHLCPSTAMISQGHSGSRVHRCKDCYIGSWWMGFRPRSWNQMGYIEIPVPIAQRGLGNMVKHERDAPWFAENPDKRRRGKFSYIEGWSSLYPALGYPTTGSSNKWVTIGMTAWKINLESDA